MKKILVILGIIAIISMATIGVVSTKMTSVSFGVNGDNRPLFTIYGFYDKSTTVYSGEKYYLHLNHDNGTFDGWYTASNGFRYDVTGTFTIVGNEITGNWKIDKTRGWLSGHIGS